MCEFQAIIDFSIQLNKFVNIDLFQRGYYQIRLALKLPNCKQIYKIEINSTNLNSSTILNKLPSSSSSLSLISNIPESNSKHCLTNETNSGNIILPASVINGTAVSKTFQIVYKNEEVILNDTIMFRVNICIDTNEFIKQIQRVNFILDTELWFTDKEFLSNQHHLMESVSSRQLQIHFDFCRGIHYNLPVIFDYFHLSTITLTIHGSLVTICQPYICKNDGTSFWLSNFIRMENKDDKKTSYRNQSLDNEKKLNQFAVQIRSLQLVQYKLVSSIVYSFLTLRSKINEYYRVLPPWQQAKVDFKNLFSDISFENLSFLSQECFRDVDKNEDNLSIASIILRFQSQLHKNISLKKDDLNSTNIEDLITTIEHDVAYICALTIDQWHRFLRLVINSDRINQHLAKIHHLQRIKRFSEGFFCIENTRANLNGLCDQNSSIFLEISEIIRKSPYFTLLPPCDVECIQLDGVSSTLPIIFEEKYEVFQLTTENTNRINSSLQEINLILPANSSSNSLGYYSSPSKYSISSSSTSSSNSSKSNLKQLISKFNDYMANDKVTKTEQHSPSQIQKLEKFKKSQVNSVDIFGLCRNDFFKEENCNNCDNINTKIKLINTFLNKKDIIKSCSKLSLDYSDKQFKKIAKTNQSTIAHLLRNTISLEQPIYMLDLNAQLEYDEKLENSRSWPNLAVDSEINSNHLVADTPASLIEKKELGKNTHRHYHHYHHHHHLNQSKKCSSLHKSHNQHKSHKFKSAKNIRETLNLEELNLNVSSFANNTPSSNYSNYKGTMYFPKPPKEFAMEGIDEPAQEVILKPIPVFVENVDVEKQQHNMQSNVSDNFDSQNLVSTEDNANSKIIDIKINELTEALTSCKDILEAVPNAVELNLNENNLTTLKNVNHGENINFDDCNSVKLNNFNEAKLTFIELLRSDHCLICCGSIKNRLDGSCQCKCKKSTCNKKVSNLSPPSLRRISTVESNFISFLHAKEDFRNELAKKVKNLLFYSDFHSLASRIPYFQCDPDFRAFNSHKDLHLIVCVHGLDGNSADLRLVKTYLELGLPTNNFEFLMSQRNQGETFDSLETLTSRLINEIDNYVATYNLNPTRLSFIGHSLGNIIIRAAISRYDFMKRWRDKLYTFLSLSGPHLGLAYNRSGLVNIGLWFIQKFKKAISLTQLSMKDSSNIRQTYLYKLSTNPGLEHFRNILLCGSSQDYYVPIHSAHMELCNAALNDTSETGVAYREMINNILQRFTNKPNLNIIRYDVHHALTSNANSLIGRAAHIAVLDSELFIEKFMVVVGLKYFV